MASSTECIVIDKIINSSFAINNDCEKWLLKVALKNGFEKRLRKMIIKSGR